jgi:hypothetical protein
MSETRWIGFPSAGTSVRQAISPAGFRWTGAGRFSARTAITFLPGRKCFSTAKTAGCCHVSCEFPSATPLKKTSQASSAAIRSSARAMGPAGSIEARGNSVLRPAHLPPADLRETRSIGANAAEPGCVESNARAVSAAPAHPVRPIPASDRACVDSEPGARPIGEPSRISSAARRSNGFPSAWNSQSR